MHQTLMQTYNPLPIELEKGEGAWVWDKSGKKYLDAFAGIAVTSIGHAHPKLIETVTQQIKKIIHTSNLLTVSEQLPLADKLTTITQMDNVFFANSGAEANECAIKLARLFGHQKEIETPTIIVMENAFHGRTLATLTASGSRRVQAGFEPLVQGFCRAPFNDLAALHAIAANNHQVVAVLVEPIQGESGIRTPDDDYLIGVRKICDQYGWLMMLDEVQTGIGRTGQWFAHQHHHQQAIPDVLTSAKALGNGIPIGACLARAQASKLFKEGNHGSTYGGNPLACAAASTVLAVIEQEGLLANANEVGSYLKNQLQSEVSGLEGVVDVRGQGLMIGVELDKPCRDVLPLAAAEGLLVNVAGGNTLRIVPPLLITKSDADFIVNVLKKAIPQFMAKSATAA